VTVNDNMRVTGDVDTNQWMRPAGMNISESACTSKGTPST
jgi:hypothetical protein